MQISEKRKLNTLKRFIFGTISMLFLSINLINFAGCSGCPYSFTGSSVPPHLRTIAIPFADDRSGSGNTEIREKLTKVLTQKFIEDNSFKIAERTKADAIIEMYIASWDDAAAVVSSGETIQTRRITIGVQVVYKDLVQKKTVYEKRFSDYGDYPAGSGIEGIQKGIETAIDRITDTILLDTVSGW